MQAIRIKPTCGARTRQGSPCQCKPEPDKERCKLHGGRSTGPRTAEGIERIKRAQALRWHGRSDFFPAAPAV